MSSLIAAWGVSMGRVYIISILLLAMAGVWIISVIQRRKEKTGSGEKPAGTSVTRQEDCQRTTAESKESQSVMAKIYSGQNPEGKYARGIAKQESAWEDKILEFNRIEEEKKNQKKIEK